MKNSNAGQLLKLLQFPAKQLVLGENVSRGYIMGLDWICFGFGCLAVLRIGLFVRLSFVGGNVSRGYIMGSDWICFCFGCLAVLCI